MIKTGYFWEIENRMKVVPDKAFSKILYDFSVVYLNVPYLVLTSKPMHPETRQIVA